MEIGIHSDESVINMVVGEDKPVDPDVIPMLSPITWTTTDEAVAYATSTGVFHAVGTGTATITGTIYVTIDGVQESRSETWTVNVASQTLTMDDAPLLLNAGDTHTLEATLNAEGVDITWSSSDESVATVDNYGVVTAHKAGFAYITEMASQGGAMDIHKVICQEIVNTNDGFGLSLGSIATTLKSYDIYYLCDDDGIMHDVDLEYSDWYLYGVESSNGSATHGLLKMTTINNNTSCNPIITISFVDFEFMKLYNCLMDSSYENQYILYDEIIEVTTRQTMLYSQRLEEYFERHESDAPYLIAEQYIKKIINMNPSGTIYASDRCESIINEYNELKLKADSGEEIDDDRYKKVRRIPEALIQNNVKAGKEIYNFDNHTITIENSNCLTVYEKYAILMTTTGNVNFNSFAAEVVFHADCLDDSLISGTAQLLFGLLGETAVQHYVRSRAIRADMSLNLSENALSLAYYNLNAYPVEQQRILHGDY